MTRYIDADALIKKMFPLGIGDGMYVINAKAVKFAIDNTPAADVVPKSEVESILDEIEKTIRAALILVDFSYKHNIKEKQCKKECYEDFLGYIAELKKKYTEGKTDAEIH